MGIVDDVDGGIGRHQRYHQNEIEQGESSCDRSGHKTDRVQDEYAADVICEPAESIPREDLFRIADLHVCQSGNIQERHCHDQLPYNKCAEFYGAARPYESKDKE